MSTEVLVALIVSVLAPSLLYWLTTRGTAASKKQEAALAVEAKEREYLRQDAVEARAQERADAILARQKVLETKTDEVHVLVNSGLTMEKQNTLIALQLLLAALLRPAGEEAKPAEIIAARTRIAELQDNVDLRQKQTAVQQEKSL